MLLPYNVDRPTRLMPVVTYALIAANIFIFLMSVLVSNLNLSADREAGKQAIATLTANDDATKSVLEQFDGPSEPGGRRRRSDSDEPGASQDSPPDSQSGQPQEQEPQSDSSGQSQSDEQGVLRLGQMSDSDDSGDDSGGNARLTRIKQQWQQERALEIVSEHMNSLEQYQTAWQIEHAYSSWTLEPHYSFMSMFSYRVNDPSPLHQLFSMLTSIFLHANFEHIAGNMLFLWIFGRAAEEFLGWKIYTPIYFFAGLAATLLSHFMAVILTPNSLGLPNLGASGAIAGVLGLFAVRFYRTKVRVFYMWPWAGFVASIAFIVVFLFVNSTLHDVTTSIALSVIGVVGLMFAFGRDWLWGSFRRPSAWVIGVWVVISNLLPAIWQAFQGHEGGGVSYWAHIGGFGLGTLYAALIGGVEEGRSEYAIEDAQTALQTARGDDALFRAQKILESQPTNAQAHEIAARACDAKGDLPAAQTHYQSALETFWKANDRAAASALYLQALPKHPQLAMRPALLLGIGGQLAQTQRWNDSAAVLVRLIEEFEGTPESEIALLRCAQMWLRQFGDPAEATRQLELFLGKYPDSQWRPQAQDALAAARTSLAR